MTIPHLSLSPFTPGRLPLDPQKDLYGRLLFHRGRFCRLRGYQLLQAKQCVAEITQNDGTQWFGPYLPVEFVLGNPAARDAALHAIQACIPHRQILPTGIEHLAIFRNVSGPHFVRAKERRRDGDNFVYDVEVTDADGEVIELWNGLCLRAVEIMTAHDAWPDALLAPYLERRLEEFTSGLPVKVALERGQHRERSARSDAAIQRALGKTAHAWRRIDGRPFVPGGEAISAAHVKDLTLAVAGSGDVACDLEEVSARPEVEWRELLGVESFQLAGRIAHEQSETLDAAATRLWTALECLKKIGQPVTAPLVLESNTEDGWALLRSGQVAISTCVVIVRGNSLPLAVAVALKSGGERRAPLAQVFTMARAGL